MTPSREEALFALALEKPAEMIKFGQHHLHYSRLTMPDGHAATMLSTRFAKQQNPEFPTGHQATRVVPKG